jgi:hypothetical protein
MSKKIITLMIMLGVMFLGLDSVHSATTQELERQISELSGKVEKMRTRARRSGGSSSGSNNKTTVLGYGEMHGTIAEGHNKIDQHRFVIGVQSQLSDWISFSAEIDYEHAGQLLEFEFGFLDFSISPEFNIRAGSVLIPVGLLNEFHEPNRFLTTERPDLHKYVIPTSWSGGGAGIFGSLSNGLTYRVYVVNSLQSVKSAGASSGSGNGNGGSALQFKDTSGIRSGRGELNNRTWNNIAITGRVEKMLVPGLNVGASFYGGNTAHGQLRDNRKGFLFLSEADVQYRKGAFEMNSTIANINIQDTAELNQFAADEGTQSGAIGKRIFGFNVQAGVHLLQLAGKSTKHDLIAHAMYESIDTQADLDDSCQATKVGAKTRDCAVDHKAARDIVHFGLTYKPIPAVALKLDHKIIQYAYDVANGGDKQGSTHLGIAYMY